MLIEFVYIRFKEDINDINDITITLYYLHIIPKFNLIYYILNFNLINNEITKLLGKKWLKIQSIQTKPSTNLPIPNNKNNIHKIWIQLNL